MITKVEGTGKNIEQAVENALFELKASRQDVDIKILEQGGLFKKAKVIVSISEDSMSKYVKKEEFKKQEKIEEEIEQEKTKEEKPVKEAKSTTVENKKVSSKKQEKVVVESQPEVVEKVVENMSENTNNDDRQNCEHFLQGILDIVAPNAHINITENEDELIVGISGERAEDLIGFRGDCINAVQYLASVYISKNNRHSKKVRVDIEGYRRRREETLVALANRIAKKVQKTKNACKLEPMTANERRIIHTALQNFEDIETISKGEEPHRFLTVYYKEIK